MQSVKETSPAALSRQLNKLTDAEFASIDFTVYDNVRRQIMSKWDEAHTEPMHDHPAEKEQLVAAMEAAGYVLDTLESTEDNLAFMGLWQCNDYGRMA
jgi:hypothetical protein